MEIFWYYHMLLKGSATITFDRLESAEKAVSEYNDRLLDSRPMKIFLLNSK